MRRFLLLSVSVSFVPFLVVGDGWAQSLTISPYPLAPKPDAVQEVVEVREKVVVKQAPKIVFAPKVEPKPIIMRAPEP
ncbi:MAG: hypothetical protein ACRBCT_06535, partial [Alphaproteobacteria bacterium]